MTVRLSLPRRGGTFLRRWAAPLAVGAVLVSAGAVAANAAGVTHGSASSRSGVKGSTASADSSMSGMSGMSGDMSGMDAAGMSARSGTTPGRGPNEFGLTKSNVAGRGALLTYSHGYFCDTTVVAFSATRCEVGAPARVAPMRHTNPLFVIVPLGFTVPMQHCAAALTCVDHPMTLDMTRLVTALAPVFKSTPAALLPMLRNFPTPAHDHLIASTAGGRPQWWDVRVIGVTDPAVYQQIRQHGSLTFVQALLAAHDPRVLGPIPTNLFLFFAASTTSMTSTMTMH